MFDKTAENPPTGLLDTASEFLVGGGILTMALFPLAVPIVALLIVAVLPLLAVGALVAVVGLVLAAPVVLVRKLRKRLATPRDRRETRLAGGNRPVIEARREPSLGQ